MAMAEKQWMSRKKSQWQEKGSLPSKQGLHEGLIHQAPNLLAHAVSIPTASLTLQLFYEVCLGKDAH